MQPASVHKTFHLLMIMKAIGAASEILASAFFLLVRPEHVRGIIVRLLQSDLVEDPTDFIGNSFLRFAEQLSLATEHFLALYLLLHGLIKIGLIRVLWKKHWWAYPAFIFLMLAFVVYQLLRFQHTHAWWLLIFSVFDLVVIWFTFQEYKDHLSDVKQSIV